MITCRDVVQFMESKAPVELAEEWDNTGLLVGNEDNPVGKIMLCMDITADSLNEAVKSKADMIITHHPVIFKGIKSLTENKSKGKLLYGLIRNNISVYAAHTNLDYAESGVNFQLAAALGLKETAILGKGPGKWGRLNRKISLEEFIGTVKGALKVPQVRVVGNASNGVQKVAVFSGSFDDDLDAVNETGADVLVTGDVKYHTALDAVEAGICIIDAGHFNTEKIVLPWLAESLRLKFPDIAVYCFDMEADPFKTC